MKDISVINKFGTTIYEDILVLQPNSSICLNQDFQNFRIFRINTVEITRFIRLILCLKILIQTPNIDFQKNVWSQTAERLETSEVFNEIIYLNVYS